MARYWRELYGLVSTGLGISPDAVDRMTLSRVEELIVYWGDYPPPHILVRGAVGFKGRSSDDEPPPPGAL